MSATKSKEYYDNISFEDFVSDFAFYACKWSTKVQAVLCENIREYFEDKAIVRMVKVYKDKKAVYEREVCKNFESAARGVKGYEIHEIDRSECGAYFQVLTDILVQPILDNLDQAPSKD